MNVSSILFDPLLGWNAVLVSAGLAAFLLAFAAWRGLAGWFLRFATAVLILGTIANPSLQLENRAPLSDIVLVLADESASQGIADRPSQARAAVDALSAQIAKNGGAELRLIPVGDASDNGGTLAMAALNAELANIPQDRLAGVIVVSDGQIHDATVAPDLPVPMHLLLTGRSSDWDRRLIVDTAPAFAILGEPVTLTVRIEDQGAVPAGVGPAELAVSVDGSAPLQFSAVPGETLELNFTLPHGGINVVHLAVANQPGELTNRNNEAIVQINGVRDRLSVLLVSGEPHPGGRTWRNLLKSDSAVDLVHFTILRPPEKQDGVPVSELSLIAFPTRELFLDKIDEFDLIIFDRYQRRGILPGQYLGNIKTYVELGGALLLAAGPEFATANSLYHSELGEILPGVPTSRVLEQPFKPQVSDLGRRHPVTAGLDGEWGDWLRIVEIEARDGQDVMSGPDGLPLLTLDRVGDGRVALLASDQAWLWSRGYQGGGPQLELLRRLAHWMMKEPELEEEALMVVTDGQHMSITRRSLSDAPRLLSITGPDGQTVEMEMPERGPGLYTAEYDGPDIGLYRLEQDNLVRVAALGPSSPKEFEETIATGTKLQDAVAATGGAVRMLEDGHPGLRWVPQGRAAAGRGWIGLNPRNASVTTSVMLRALLPAWAALALIAGFALAGWLREGRR